MDDSLINDERRDYFIYIRKKGQADKMNHDNYYELYLQELAAIRPCEDTERRELLAELSRGQKEAGARLIEGHLYLIPELLPEFENRGVAAADLVQEANMALTVAILACSDTGVYADDFTGTLKQSIRLAMTDALGAALTDEQSTEEILARVNVLNQVSQMLAKDLGREADLSELAETMKMSEDEVRAIMKITLDAMSVD